MCGLLRRPGPRALLGAAAQALGRRRFRFYTLRRAGPRALPVSGLLLGPWAALFRQFFSVLALGAYPGSVEQRQLGSCGIQVGCVGLGTYRVLNVSDDAGEARCEAVVDTALENQATLFDSSPMYGEAERVLSVTLGDRREQAVIATKVWARSRAIGEQQIEKALSLYESVDIYQVHNLLATEEHLPFLQHLKAGGRVKAVGASHYLPSAVPDLLKLMRDGRVDVVQVPYHPLERSVEGRLLPEAERLGIGVIVMSPLGAGQLVRRSPTAEQLAPLAPFGVHSWAQVLLKWILSNRQVHSVIPATSSTDHMRENCAAGSAPWFSGDERMYVRKLAAELA